MHYSLTIFHSIFDNQTVKRMDFDSWDKLEKLLYSLAAQPGYKAKKGENRKSSPLISPAIYKPDSTRANANVTAWAGWAALDVDSCTGTVEEALCSYKDYYFVCYSTASCRIDKPKFRLVFPLTQHVSAEKIRPFWFALNEKFNSIGDKQTKDLSRMYYVPAKYPEANNFIFVNKGRLINPNEFMAEHPHLERSTTGSFIDKFPEHIQKELLEMRKTQMVNRDIQWSSYLDCPFVSKQLLKEYRSIAQIDGSGRYRLTYKIMTSIACNAVKRKYPISASEISELITQLDSDTSNIYKHRALKVEADRAIEYAYKHATVSHR